ncbi:MAG: hypothetical protein A2166_03975 [Omnitrophica WOR_2 bacterium RBG_13_41_10]|nr:MAG: hypothetical protein A2166_03975 [Omnitrophica WOR_2 bacterium RBG_13_41_10]
MDKERSMGVTVFGWLFIIGGILGILGKISAAMRASAMLDVKYILAFVISALCLTCGIYLLKLRPWAKQLAIVLAGINTIYALIIFNGLAKTDYSKMMDYASKKQEQMVQEQYKPEYQKKALEAIERQKQITEKAMPILFAIVTGITIGWNIIIIFFFTRPKVKEQFTGAESPQRSGGDQGAV